MTALKGVGGSSGGKRSRRGREASQTNTKDGTPVLMKQVGDYTSQTIDHSILKNNNGISREHAGYYNAATMVEAGSMIRAIQKELKHGQQVGARAGSRKLLNREDLYRNKVPASIKALPESRTIQS